MNAGLVSKVPEALTDTVGAFFVAEKQPRQLVTHCQNKVTNNAQTNSSCVRIWCCPYLTKQGLRQ